VINGELFKNKVSSSGVDEGQRRPKHVVVQLEEIEQEASI